MSARPARDATARRVESSLAESRLVSSCRVAPRRAAPRRTLRHGRDRFSVIGGKTSVLDLTDSSSAVITISGSPPACRRPTINNEHVRYCEPDVQCVRRITL